jgi:hypothetical protein
VAGGRPELGVETVPLGAVEDAWRRGSGDGRRIVLVP